MQIKLAKLYPDRREDGETTLRQCQLVITRMLRIFDHICRENGISYWITGGTIIGALRHKGFVPWDADVDIAMMEIDFGKFLLSVHKLPNDIFFQSEFTDPNYSNDTVTAKLRDRHSNYYQWQSENPWAKHHNGLQLDIFVWPEVGDGKLKNLTTNELYGKDEIFPLIDLNFEGFSVKAPNDPEAYTRRRYGDYTVLPPEEERIAHEGLADPFNPCAHPESRPYRYKKLSNKFRALRSLLSLR